MAQNEDLMQNHLPTNKMVLDKSCTTINRYRNINGPKFIDVLYAKQPRISLDGILLIEHGGIYYKVLLDRNNNLSILEDVQLPKLSTKEYTPDTPLEIQYLEHPLFFDIDSIDASWGISTTQFYTNIFVKCEDDILEALIFDVMIKHKIIVHAWDSYEHEKYNWIIKIPAGLNQSKISGKLFDFFQSKAKDITIKILKGMLNTSGISDREPRPATFSDEERDYLLNEIEILSKELSKLNTKASENSISDSDIYTIRNLKRSPFEKFFARALFEILNNLAISPDSVNIMIKKFSDPRAILRLLKLVNSGVEVKVKSIQGLAGTKGWREITDHISTGLDSRGRIYIRKSINSHLYDVVIHWKANDKEQSRKMNQIASYDYFEGPEVILS